MTASSSASSLAANGSSTLVRLGRLGYASKGVVYVVMGFLATEAAFHRGGKTTDTKGAIRTIAEGPFGKFAVVVIVIGLLGYAAWRLVSAATDAERRGDKPSSLALRAGEAFRGLAYGSLGLWALKLLRHEPTSSGNQTRNIVDKTLGLPGGKLIVILAGIAFIGYGIYQVYRAVTGKFMKHLDVSGDPKTRDLVENFGRFGIVARAIVFAMIGFLLVRAGQTYDPAKAGGIAQSLDAISREPRGPLLFAAVAIGLIAFGLFQIATAKYRVMRAT